MAIITDADPRRKPDFYDLSLCAKGTEGNDYGPQRPTPGWERVLGWIYIILIPLALVLLSLPQSCLPTYEGYVEKSESVVIGTPSQSQ